MDDIQFERISIESGLSQSSVLTIYQDSRGFLWFGTYEGLNRYDGYNFKVYKSDPGNPYGLSHNHIECITEDHLGMLWIGTEGGLNRFNRETEQFINYKNNFDNPHSLGNNHILCVYEDRQGVLWVGTYGGGLNRFDREKEQFIRYVHDPSDPKSLSHDNVLCIIEDSRGRLWIGTDGGLNCFDRDSETFIRYQHDSRNPYSVSHDAVNRIYEDRAGRLWIGTWGGGLNLFDPLRNRFTRYMHKSGDPQSLSNNVIRSICEDRDGELWIGTDGGGLNIFDPDFPGKIRDQFIHYRTNTNDPNSLSSNVVLAIFEDKSGVLWIGTDFGGINKFNPGKRKFAKYRNSPDDSNSLSSDVIFSVYEDNQGIIWIGTNGGGLNRFDRQRNRFTHYVHDPGNPASLSDNRIRSICEDRYHRLWVATDNGLNRFDPLNRNFIKYFPDPDNPNSISHSDVWTLYKDRTGNLWVGTTGGLNRFNYENERFIRYMPDENNPHSISDRFIWSIYEDSQNVFWIATNTGGLNRFDPKKETFVHYTEMPGDSGGLSDNKVLCIHEDRTGTLWFGTTKGLNKWDWETEKFIRFGVKAGLSSNTIQSILEDDHGNLWIGTNNGLSRFDPNTGRVRNYSENEGLQSKEFSVNACCRLGSGEMVFGGINGFNIFHPDSIKDNPGIPSVVITDFEIFNKSVAVGQEIHGHVVLEKSISECEEIALCYKDNIISFEFAALHYVSPENNLYAYMMEGFEKTWNYTDANRRFASYTNLTPGKYVFRVRASNCDGVWNEKGKAIRITITPPFWKTLWFRILIILFIAGCIVFGLIIIIRWVKIRADIALAREQHLMKALLNTVTDHIYFKDRESRFIRINKSLADWFGIEDPEEAIGKTDFDFFSDEHAKQAYEDEQKIIQTGKQLEGIEEKETWPDGRETWVSSTKAPLFDRHRNIIGTFGISRDITEHKEAQEALERAKKEIDQKAETLEQMNIALQKSNEELEQANKEVETQRNFLAKTAKELEIFNEALTKSNEELQQFAYVASHDLQEPLRMISSYLGLIDRKYTDKLDKDGKEFIEYAVGGAKRMQAMINDLLQYSRVTTQGKPFEKTNMEEVLEKVLMNLKIAIEESGGEVTHDKLPEIMADRVQMERLLQNLLGNAIKYRGERKPKVHVSVKKKKGEYEFSVQDNGIGIEKEYQEKIFGIFQRLHTREEYAGTGIGLAVCKKIVERHGGKIWVDGKLNEGSTFWFAIPVFRA